MAAFVGILLLALIPMQHRELPLRPGDAVTVHIPHKGTKEFVIRDMGWGWMLESNDGTLWNIYSLRRYRWKKAK
jgi:hypothetical protein